MATRGTYLFEGAQACENAATGPRGVYPLRRRQYFDSHVLHRQSLHFVQQPVAKPLGQCGPAREHNVTIEGFSEVHVGPMYCFDHDLMDTRVL
jgi:hypothetical protein